MNSEPTEKPSEPIVKISFISHNREYEIGIQRFFKELGATFSNDDILIAVKKILSKT